MDAAGFPNLGTLEQSSMMPSSSFSFQNTDYQSANDFPSVSSTFPTSLLSPEKAPPQPQRFTSQLNNSGQGQFSTGMFGSAPVFTAAANLGSNGYSSQEQSAHHFGYPTPPSYVVSSPPEGNNLSYQPELSTNSSENTNFPQNKPIEKALQVLENALDTFDTSSNPYQPQTTQVLTTPEVRKSKRQMETLASTSLNTPPMTEIESLSPEIDDTTSSGRRKSGKKTPAGRKRKADQSLLHSQGRLEGTSNYKPPPIRPFDPSSWLAVGSLKPSKLLATIKRQQKVIRLAEKSNTVKDAYCTPCDKVISFGSMERHVAMHFGGPLYACKICDYTHHAPINNHMSTHGMRLNDQNSEDRRYFYEDDMIQVLQDCFKGARPPHMRDQSAPAVTEEVGPQGFPDPTAQQSPAAFARSSLFGLPTVKSRDISSGENKSERCHQPETTPGSKPSSARFAPIPQPVRMTPLTLPGIQPPPTSLGQTLDTVQRSLASQQPLGASENSPGTVSWSGFDDNECLTVSEFTMAGLASGEYDLGQRTTDNFAGQGVSPIAGLIVPAARKLTVPVVRPAVKRIIKLFSKWYRLRYSEKIESWRQKRAKTVEKRRRIRPKPKKPATRRERALRFMQKELRKQRNCRFGALRTFLEAARALRVAKRCRRPVRCAMCAARLRGDTVAGMLGVRHVFKHCETKFCWGKGGLDVDLMEHLMLKMVYRCFDSFS